MKKLHNLLLVVLAAAMMSTGWLELTGLVMLAGFVPLLVLASRYDASRRSFWAMTGWIMLFIVLWYAATVWWVWYSTPAGPIAATFFACVYTGLPFMLWFFVSKRAPKVLSYTVLVTAWTVGEWIFNTNQASFPWLNIGNGFASDIALVQWYEWTGIYGGTVWVLVTSILIYEFLIVRRVEPLTPRRQRPQRIWATRNILPPALAIIVPILISLALYFTYEEPSRTAKVTIVQPNMDPYKDVEQDVRVQNLLDLASEAPADVDFIVMPEVALDERIIEGNLASSHSLTALRNLAAEKYPNATIVVGATSYKLYGPTKQTPTARGDNEIGYYDVFNTAVAIAPDGTTNLHHKAKLVIGTEMMPDWWWIEALRLKELVADVGGMQGQLGYGTVRTVFDNGKVYAGAGICWESLFGEYFTEFVRNGAETLFVITNDGWWRNTPGHRQHFDFSRLRAVETRRTIARSANTGRSGFITSRGDVLETLEWDVRGTITDEISLSRRTTLYVRFGDYLCRISLLVLGLSMLYFVAWRIRKKDHIVK